ncbi:MAG: hypothetical protein EOP83_19995 [Verrucomicrobiaceae bacterium]|nr:MAG: hypothetical protein EOP83_19995 [Verrucomicrobiaceae bacterium]
MMPRELKRPDVRTLKALQAAIKAAKDSEEGDGISIEMSGKRFSMLPMNQHVRFKGEEWSCDCPVKYTPGQATRSYISGDPDAFDIDMMLLKLSLNVAENSGF